jgi:hypothetical protein
VTAEASKVKCDIQCATALATANQALNDAWPYMEPELWFRAKTAVSNELGRYGLPPDLRPVAVASFFPKQL